MNKDILSHIDKGRVFAIIPARSGSKGVKDKNIRMLGNHPLIAYSIAAAKLANGIDRVIVSTDSEQYAAIAGKYGAETPFLRPADISGDRATDIEFMQHAINWFYENEGIVPEYWVHLRTTSPDRKPEIIDEAIKKIKDIPDATALLSVCIPEGVLTPFKWMIKTDDGRLKSIFFENNDDANRPRQSYPEAYMRSSYVDILKTDTIVGLERFYGQNIVPFDTNQIEDIDNLSDFESASARVETFDKNVLAYLEASDAKRIV